MIDFVETCGCFKIRNEYEKELFLLSQLLLIIYRKNVNNGMV